MRTLHVISGLSLGGAEQMLWKLLSASRSPRGVEVISLTDIGPVGQRIERLQVPVKALGTTRTRPGITALLRLAYWIHQFSPQIVQTWMYHADLLGGLAARLSGKIPVVWGIRNGLLEPRGNKRTTIFAAKACAFLSGYIPRRIVVNSEKARLFHEQMGYCARKMTVIPNGFDLAALKPDPGARIAFRTEIGVPLDAVLIGLVARYDVQKDHRNFIEAARLFVRTGGRAHFLLCGTNVNWENAELAEWIRGAGIRGYCHLTGCRDDIPRVMASLDIAACSSYAEAFPNVLGEAMACGVPCATTDAGESAVIVGDTGVVVPPRDPKALAEAWGTLIALGAVGREELGRKARRRIEERYDLGAIAARYARLYEEVALGNASLIPSACHRGIQDRA